MENARVIRSAFKIGGFTLLSRFLGLVRDTVTASVFGTTVAMSDFVVAFRLPNLFRALFGEGALSSAFVPVFLETRRKAGDADAWRVAARTFSLVALILVAIVVAGIAAATVLMHAAPALAARAPLLLPLTRIMLPYIVFICLAGLFMAMLNAYHRFNLPAFTPSLLNITWILFVLFVCPRFGATREEQIFGVAWGVFVAGLLQMGVQLPALWRLGFRPAPCLPRGDERVWRVFKLMAPTALGSSVTQVNVLVNTLLARWAAPWAPASLFYAERLLYFPQGILATALSTVLLPVFSGHAAQGDHGEMRRTLNHSLRTLLFVMAPASVGLLVLAAPITELLFGWGVFDRTSVGHTAVALQFYAPGLLVFCLAKVFVPAFYALQDTRTPFRVGLVAVGLNFCLNVVFVLTWPLHLKHAGLAFATVISEAVNGVTLGFRLDRALGSPGWREIARSAARSLGCTAVMAAAVLLAHRMIGASSGGWPVKLAQAAGVFGSIAAGMIVYFAAAAAMRCPEIGFVADALRRRRSPLKVAPPENP